MAWSLTRNHHIFRSWGCKSRALYKLLWHKVAGISLDDDMTSTDRHGWASIVLYSWCFDLLRQGATGFGAQMKETCADMYACVGLHRSCSRRLGGAKPLPVSWASNEASSRSCFGDSDVRVESLQRPGVPSCQEHVVALVLEAKRFILHVGSASNVWPLPFEGSRRWPKM